ncbi:type III secretion effector protein [Pseudomonas kairouanensis]|uniref:Type III secretion effector protein n=2 Tax=Pseudomonas kairouanensis TaxID=2293832 RepID=A0A4Z0AJI7_9PSED|nr:type III secretion effector protein [Pseudomonas kairouanensis]
MKDFAGQRRFQAPVADDFARGMLAPGQSLKTQTHSLAQIRGALATVILGLRALCAGQKLD